MMNAQLICMEEMQGSQVKGEEYDETGDDRQSGRDRNGAV